MERFEKQLNMEEIKRWFDPDKWDIGYLTKEQLEICSNSPIKGGPICPFPVWNFSNAVHYNWKNICNGIVLINHSSISWDYSLYEKATKILIKQGLEEYVDWAHFYTNFKEAEIISGRGVRARNSLVYNYKFGFDSKVCVIGFMGMIQNPPKIKRVAGNNFKEEFWHNCIGCDACREVCPVGAIHNNESIDWLDGAACDTFLSYSDHPSIPSVKKYWHENLRPDVPKELVDEITNFWEDKEMGDEKGNPFMDWNVKTVNQNGETITEYTSNNGIFRKDGKQILVPICRECQVQAPCSEWGGKYPYGREMMM